MNYNKFTTWLLGAVLAVCLGVPDLQAQTVTQVLGANVQCDPTVDTCLFFPTSGAFLCNGTGAILDCPQYFGPDWVDATGLRFFGLTNRTNPPRCVQSTDGGTVWGLCPSNPFAGAVDVFGAFFAVASDGSLIAAAEQGVNNCIIRRSTDYGTSWSTVYTDATASVSCGVSFGNPTPNVARCASTGGYCVVINRLGGSFNLWAVFSTDNGATWNKGTAFNIVTSNEQIAVETEGTMGGGSRFAITYSGGGQDGFERISGDWDDTIGVFPAPVGAIGNTSSGTAALIFEGRSTIIAGPTSNPSTTHYRYDIVGGTPAEMTSFIPLGAPAFANGPAFMAHSFGAIGYFITRNLANTTVNIYISTDSFGTVALNQALTPATALIAGCCVGDIHTFHNKIYFTGGGTASNAWLARIQ